MTVQGTSHIGMDDEHNVIADPNVDIAYKVSPCATLVIDTDGYTITVPTAAGVDGPNAIHLYQSNSNNMYRAPWDTREAISLNADALQCLNGDKEFSGFQSGQSFLIAVGYDNMPLPAGSKIQFTPMWVAKLAVSAEGT